MTTKDKLTIAGAALVLTAGCASVDPQGDLERVGEVVAPRLVLADGALTDGALGHDDEQVEAEVDRLLGPPLTMDAAVRLALLNSPGLRAEYARLGVARAEFVQAGLLPNPTLGATWQGVNGGSGERFDVGLTQSLLDLPLRPAQKRLARIDLEAARLQTAQQVLATAFDVRRAFVDLAAAASGVADLERVEQSTRAGAELARRQREAGNINALEYAERRALAAEAEAGLEDALLDEAAAREHLGLLLGVEPARWSIDGELSLPPAVAAEVDELTALALERRLDLAADRLQVEMLAEALEVTLRWRWFVVADVGVAYEEEVDGVELFGPTLSVQLPIFDRGQARVARIEALERVSRRQLTQTALAVRSEVREASARLRSQRRLAEQAVEVLLPARREIVAEAQKHYNYMLLGAYRLLAAHRDQIAAESQHRRTLRDAWRAWIDLEQAVAGPLPAAGPFVEEPQPEAEEQETEQEMEHEHHE